MKVCPSCGERNAATSMLCTRCAVSLISVPISDPSTAIIQEGRSKVEGDDGLSCPNCGALNSREAQICETCSSRLSKGEDCCVARGFAIEWPWSTVVVSNYLAVGRDPEFSPVAEELEKYDRVSRRHAEFRIGDGCLFLKDVGSSNGTFVNERRLFPHEEVEVRIDTVIRFASQLTVKIRPS